MRKAATSLGLTALRVLVVTGAVGWASACHEPLDTTRQAGQKATFGDDLYGVFCDRLGAELFQEDLTGASYQSVCHYDDKGAYGDEVDASALPKPKSDKAKRARSIAIAKMNALVRRRADLVRAFNATFPDIDIDNPATKKDASDTVNLLDAMMDLGQRVSALYEQDPYAVAAGDPFAEPLAPAATRSMGRLFDSMSESEEAKAMLSRMWGRRGYRPAHVGLGIVRSSLDYPNLRELTTRAVSLLGPDGTATPQLQALLGVMEREMRHMKPEVSTLPGLTVNAAVAQPNRPRTTIEMLRKVMLDQNDRYAVADSDPPRYIALRDLRGYVMPAQLGGLFADGDGDGRADVDDFGRFLDASGSVLALDPPFAIPGQAPIGPLDDLGRPADAIYAYVDTARTPAAGLSTIMVPLLDSTEYADPEDPNAFMAEYETLMYMLAGANVLLGPREEAAYDFESDQIVADSDCDSCLKYNRFRGEDSPLVDAAHAVGQILADEESDIALLGMIDLLENHEDKVARLVAAALRIREIALEHDELAAQGVVPPAGLPYENPVWDEAAQVISAMTDEPRLLANVVGALADPVIVSPRGGSNHLGETIALFAGTVDELDYDSNDINGPAVNLTDGGFSISDPHNPVDWLAPRNGKNRSILERSLLLIHDAAGAKTCNKNGAVVKADVLGISLDWPLSGSYGPCELFEIRNLAAFYFGAIVHEAHPKRAQFVLKDGALNEIMDLMGFIATPDETMQASSGLLGMTTRPTPNALNRLVYFGATSDQFPGLPDFDAINAGGKTDEFIHALMEPVPTSVCPVDGFGLANCQPQDLLRSRTGEDIFNWERRGFYDYMRPVITAFVNVSCSEDVTICDANDFTGEEMFLRLSDTFYKHYPGPDHGDECSSAIAPTDRRFCSEAGINAYEPILEKAMRTGDVR